MLKVRKLTKRFGDQVALDEISFEIGKGKIFGFLGPSGSGKTTTINILTGQLLADAGTAEVFGKAAQELTSKDMEQIGIVSDTSGFYEKLTLYKNMLTYSKLYGVSNERVDELLKLLGLYDSKDKPAEKLSTGMKQRMLLARALINSPALLFLDEPTSGLDPSTSRVVHDLLLSLKAQGVTIFLTTHDMHEATLLCDNLALLHKGRLVEIGSPKALIQKYHTDKKVQLTYSDGKTATVGFDDLATLSNTGSLETVHSCEPTLEDIFITLTGGKLDA